LAVNQVAANRSWFRALLQQPDNRQALLQEFVLRFNAVELDMRKADETKVRSMLCVLAAGPVCYRLSERTYSTGFAACFQACFQSTPPTLARLYGRGISTADAAAGLI
jgi:hypothetical protein